MFLRHYTELLMIKMVHMIALLCLCFWRLTGVFGVEVDETESLSVVEGNSVTLRTGVTKIQEDDLIMWMCGDYCIAKLNISSQVISESSDRLGDRLQLDQTGSLTITNIRTTDSGVYKAQMIGQKVSKKTFYVTVSARLPVPVIASYCPQNPSGSSDSKCVLLCSVVNVSHVSLSWYKGNSSLSSISVSDLSISLSLPLEVEYQDTNTYSCMINNPVSNQTQLLDISQICRPCSECVCCCDSTEAAIQLVISVLVGVATVVVLVYDISSSRAERKRRAQKPISNHN